MSAASAYAAGITELATTMSKKGCVWFVGAGFSLASGLPGVQQVSLALLRNAVLGLAPLAQRTARYEAIKRTLLGNYLSTELSLKEQSDDAGIRQEIDWIEAESRKHGWPNRPQWLLDLVNLGRIAEVVHRTASGSEPGDSDIELAACLGLDNALVWEKKPSFAHHLLALLVMEGLIPQIITLNYDDQIERACEQVRVKLQPIRDRAEYRDGAAGRWEGQPALFKVHGCRSRYLDALVDYQSNPSKQTRAILVEGCQALVVTDRQLQHWRDSRWAWARDLFQDLLRRRPFVFIGFSASDLVLQATLNALAEEIEDSRCEVFVAPSLSFPFYQFLSKMDSDFDPLHPKGVLEAKAEKLLPDLYPEAVAAHFTECLRCEPPSDLLQGIATDRHHLPAQIDMAGAYAAATRLLTSAARQVAAEDVRVCTPRNPDQSLVPEQYVRVSTVRRLMHNLIEPAPNEGYLPLLTHKEEYRRTAQVLAIMLAVKYPSKTVMDQLTCTVDHSTDNVVLRIDDPTDTCKLRRVVLVPENWGDDPETWLQAWMGAYFEQRRMKGLLEEGTHTLIHPYWLNEPEMKRAVSALDLDHYNGSYCVEIFAIGDHFQDQRGKQVV